MFKSTVIASALLMSSPVFGQVAAGAAQVPPSSQQGGAAIDQTQGTPSVQSTTSAESSAPQEASAQPATVATVVGTEFPTYDKDGDGALSAAEFGAWMVALKTASDPSTKATAPATKTWVTAAFAQADKDKNKKVSKTELTTFLSAAG